MTIQHVLEDVLQYSRERDYVGWDLYDGESSAILERLPVENKWVNIAFQQTVRRAPVNIRPLLFVERRRNFMGVALFALANLTMYELTGDTVYREDAHRLVDWLVENRSEGYSGFCGGHKHPVQGLETRNGPNVPGVVGTSYAVRALLAADAEFDGPHDYAGIARTAADFVFEDLHYSDEEVEQGACIKYTPNGTGNAHTLNANALGARLLLDLSERFDEDAWLDAGTGILEYVASKQTSIGGWKYTDPPSGSHLSMDNFHNGFILESFLHHQSVAGGRFEETIRDATTFYRNWLFEADGAPNWDESKTYPRDVHAVSQGAIVFSALGDHSFARQILEWGAENLYDGKGAFYQEQRRFYTKRITLMRWCQAWMAYALAWYCAAAERDGRTAEDGRSPLRDELAAFGRVTTS